MHIKPFSGHYTKSPETLDLTLEDFKDDADRLRRIICELHALVYRREVSAGLHKQLRRLAP